MDKTGNAPQTALNLQTINNYLLKEIYACDLADELDCIVSQINDLYGSSEGYASDNVSYSAMIYRLITLRNLFLKTALDNNEKLNFDRIKDEFSWVDGRV